MFLENIIDNSLFPLKSSDLVEFAFETMLLNNISALPVVMNEIIIGFVESKNLVDISSKQSIKKVITEQPNWILSDKNHYNKAVKCFGEFKAACIAIVDDEKKFIGIVSPSQLLKFLSGSYTQSAEGSIVCLEVLSRNYSLNEITRIVENNDAKILGVNIFTIPESSRISVQLKLNTVYTERILSTFQRFGYEIAVTFNSNHDESNFENRYQSLLKYLEF